MFTAWDAQHLPLSRRLIYWEKDKVFGSQLLKCFYLIAERWLSIGEGVSKLRSLDVCYLR